MHEFSDQNQLLLYTFIFLNTENAFSDHPIPYVPFPITRKEWNELWKTQFSFFYVLKATA